MKYSSSWPLASGDKEEYFIQFLLSVRGRDHMHCVDMSGAHVHASAQHVQHVYNLPSILYKVYCGHPPAFPIISLLVWLDLESEPSNVAPKPKRNPTAAEQSPPEEAQVELSMYNVNIVVTVDYLLAASFTYTAIDDHPEIKKYLLDLTQTDIHNLGLTLGLYHRHLKSMRDSGTFRDDMIDAWLQKEDQVLKRGLPTWETLVKALKDREINQIEVAKEIETDKLNVTK